MWNVTFIFINYEKHFLREEDVNTKINFSSKMGLYSQFCQLTALPHFINML